MIISVLKEEEPDETVKENNAPAGPTRGPATHHHPHRRTARGGDATARAETEPGQVLAKLIEDRQGRWKKLSIFIWTKSVFVCQGKVIGMDSC